MSNISHGDFPQDKQTSDISWNQVGVAMFGVEKHDQQMATKIFQDSFNLKNNSNYHQKIS